MKQKLLAAAIAAVACGVFSLAVKADSVTVGATFNDDSNSVGANIISNYNDTDNGSTTTTVDSLAGVYTFKVTSFTGSASSTPLTLSQVQTALGTVSSPASVGSLFSAICIDFTHNISIGTSATWTVENLASVGTLDNGVGISNHQAAAIGYLYNHYSGSNGSPASNDLAAQLQLAVWDIVYDGSAFSNGASPTPTVSYSGAVTAGSSSDAYLALGNATTAWNDTSSSTPTDVYALVTTSGTQNFTFLALGDNTSVVGTPLPRSATAGLSLLAGLAGFHLLRKRQDIKLKIA